MKLRQFVTEKDDPYKVVYAQLFLDFAKRYAKPTALLERIEEGLRRGTAAPRPEDKKLYDGLVTVFEIILDRYCGAGTGMYRGFKRAQRAVD